MKKKKEALVLTKFSYEPIMTRYENGYEFVGVFVNWILIGT